jgi:hypothetical protein
VLVKIKSTNTFYEIMTKVKFLFLVKIFMMRIYKNMNDELTPPKED